MPNTRQTVAGMRDERVVYDLAMEISDELLTVAYAAWAVLVSLLLRWRVRAPVALGAGGLQPLLADPYLIAGLRGGAQEIVRTAAASLLLRGLLRESRGELASGETAGVVLHLSAPERAVLSACRVPCTGARLLTDPEALAGAAEAMQTLERQGLLQREQARAGRRGAFGVATLVIGLPALPLCLRFMGADAGSTLGAVPVLAAAAIGHAWQACEDLQTRAARRMLRELGQAHGALLGRMKHDALNPADATLAAALFGLQFLPAERYPQIASAFPPPAPDQNAASAG